MFLLTFFLLWVLCDGLNVEVEWVIQGREMSFSGFMVEFLGYTGAFMRELPQLHLTKGLYTYSFDEPPFKESFLAELYPEEADRLQHFVSSKHSPLPSLPYS